MDPELIKLLAQGGVTFVVIIVTVWSAGRFIGKVITKFFDRLIESIDAVKTSVDSHTRIDLEHHADVREAVVRVETKIDTVLDERDRTPIEGVPQVRRQTTPRGVPAGRYHVRSGTKDDE